MLLHPGGFSRNTFTIRNCSEDIDDSVLNMPQSIVFNWINPLTTSVPHHTETSQLICTANQLIGVYMMGNIGR